MVRSAKAWTWSIYRISAGMMVPPSWLHTYWILSAFARQKSKAIERYRNFVSQGKRQPPIWGELKNQIYLGDEQFVENMQSRLSNDTQLDEIPAVQKRPVANSLAEYEQVSKTRNEAIGRAYSSGGYTMKVVADYFGLHYSMVSKVINNFEYSRTKI
ncbi:MAG: hypothetical protein ACR2P1_04220 [Pseudomonadales bacterium]